MSGDKQKKEGYKLRKAAERELEKEATTSEMQTEQNGDRDRGDTLASIRKVVSEVMTAGMSTLQAELKKELSNFRTCFRDNIRKQMDEFKSEINWKIQEATDRLDGAVKRVGEMEDSLADMGRWDTGVKDALVQLLRDQRALQDKLSDVEGRFRRNNFRIYRVPGGG